MNLMKCSTQAMALCPDRKVCCSQRYPGEFAEGSECHKFNEEVANKPMTNADYIRAMSDEEMAASPIICRTICNLIYDSGESKKYCLKDMPCSHCIRNWLKAPYKEKEE